MAISTPLIVQNISSAYFITLLSSFEFVVLYGFLLVICWTFYKPTSDQSEPLEVGPRALQSSDESNYKYTLLINLRMLFKEQLPIIWSGVANAFSSVLLTYASNPCSTPVILQAILTSTTLFFSFLLTKYYLKKDVSYKFWTLLGSIFFLFAGFILWNSTPFVPCRRGRGTTGM